MKVAHFFLKLYCGSLNIKKKQTQYICTSGITQNMVYVQNYLLTQPDKKVHEVVANHDKFSDINGNVGRFRLSIQSSLQISLTSLVENLSFVRTWFILEKAPFTFHCVRTDTS